MTPVLEIAVGLTALLWLTTGLSEWQQARNRKRWMVVRPNVELHGDAAGGAALWLYMAQGIVTQTTVVWK